MPSPASRLPSVTAGRSALRAPAARARAQPGQEQGQHQQGRGVLPLLAQAPPERQRQQRQDHDQTARRDDAVRGACRRDGGLRSAGLLPARCMSAELPVACGPGRATHTRIDEPDKS